jgi:hypothetical protein
MPPPAYGSYEPGESDSGPSSTRRERGYSTRSIGEVLTGVREAIPEEEEPQTPTAPTTQFSSLQLGSPAAETLDTPSRHGRSGGSRGTSRGSRGQGHRGRSNQHRGRR